MLLLRYSVPIVWVLHVFSAQSIAGTIYNVLPRDGLTDGWSLDGGWIETDGTLGEIWPENLEAWEIRFSSPATDHVINSSNGDALLFVTEFNNIYTNSPPSSPPLSATNIEIVIDPGSNRLMHLIFANQDIFADDFSGQAVRFSPLPDTSVRLANESCCGWLIDNSVDIANSITPFGGYTGVNTLNIGLLDAPRGEIVLASVVFVPEPTGGLLASVLIAYVTLMKRVSPI